MEETLTIGRKVFYRRTCGNPKCKVIFFRSAWQVARGQDKFCSKRCRYGLPDYNEATKAHRAKLICSLCGTEISRAPSAADATTPYCGHFCRQLGQSSERAITQLVYTPQLLKEMAEYTGKNCAFAGCELFQYRHNHRQFSNPFHACQVHHRKIKNALKQRSSKRRRLMRAHGLIQ